jgi:hypothetical protein
MSKYFDDILLDVFNTNDDVYYIKEEGVPIPNLISTVALKAAASITGGAWKIEDALRKGVGKFGEINFRKLKTKNKKKLNSLQKTYDLSDKVFNQIFNEIIASLKTNNVEKINKTINDLKAKFKLKDEEKKEVVNEILNLIFKETDQNIINLQDTQKKFLDKMYDKYGKEITNEILSFRKNILRPYNIVRRQAKRVIGGSPAKERLGITKEEWKRAISSGKEKIARKARFEKEIDEIRASIRSANKKIKDYKELNRILSVDRKLTDEEVKKIDNRFSSFVKKYKGDLSSTEFPENIKAEEVRKYYSDIKRKYETALKSLKNINKEDGSQESDEAIKNYINKISGELSNDMNRNDYDPNLLKAIDTLILRDEIRKELRAIGWNPFKKMFKVMIDEYVDQAEKAFQNIKKRLEHAREKISFNEKEKKVWGVKKSAPELSSDLDDYYLKIKEKDFEEISKEKKSKGEKEGEDKVREAKKEIENQINKFKEDLKQKMINKKGEEGEEDFKKMEGYKFFDTVKLSQLVSEKDLFKTKEEIEKQFG